MTDSRFDLGIYNAVQVCMNIKEKDRVFIITDLETRFIGEALSRESEKTGALTKTINLENYGERPLTTLPDTLLTDMLDFKPSVTFYAAESKVGEIKMRMELSAKSRQAYTNSGLPAPRHAHMVSITPQLIKEGMTADYIEINRITLEITDIVKDAKIIRVTSAKGSDITVKFNPDYNWVPCHGLYHQSGDWGNLPEGEVFTCPAEVNGILIADVLGDYFSPKYGVLDTPVTFQIQDSLVEKVICDNDEIAQEVWKYLNSSENGLRVGEFAIGTNIAVTELSGNLLQDEKIPGIHVAFGNPIGYKTGADWSSEVHVDVVPTDCTIDVDGKILMKDGKFQL